MGRDQPGRDSVSAGAFRFRCGDDRARSGSGRCDHSLPIASLVVASTQRRSASRSSYSYYQAPSELEYFKH